MVKVKLLASSCPSWPRRSRCAGAAVADPPPLYVTLPARPLRSSSTSRTARQVGTTNGAAVGDRARAATRSCSTTRPRSDMPFDLSGPGVKLVTDMAHAEEVSDAVVVTFQPNSTYTYRDDNHPERRSGRSRPPRRCSRRPRRRRRPARAARSRQTTTGNGRRRRLADGDRTRLARRRGERRRQAGV